MRNQNWKKNWRINLVLVFIFIFGAAIIVRLVYLQIIRHGYYNAQALGQQVKLKEMEGQRGEIFFRDKIKSLAINKDKWLIYVLSDEIDDREMVADALSKNLLQESKDVVLSKIENGNYYTVIKNNVNEEELVKIKNLNLRGVYWENLPARYYPQETVAAPVVGFFGGDEKGQYGLEGYYDDVLRGEKGFQQEKKGLIISSSLNSETIENGSDLYLTLDYNIQFKAESLLEDAKKLLDIESGQIIVLEPSTGKILALANFPSFNPNQYSKITDFDIFQNAATQKIFEPGSVFKPITFATALNEEKITPQTTYIDEGQVKIDGWPKPIYNYGNKVYGEQTMTNVLEKSINTGAVFVSKLIPQDTFLNYFDKFGFTEKTDIDLEGEVYSRNENLKEGREINFATASFGQGVEMTPIQIARAFCVIANGGKLVKPYIVEKIIRGSEETKIEPTILREVISPQTASQLTAMLISVVENGFAKRAKVPGYYIAGKTGTAQVPYEGKKGYYPDKTIQSFIGFAPALNPRFLALIKLDNPKSNTAEYSAVPLFGSLAKYIIDLWQIPPDYQE